LAGQCEDAIEPGSNEAKLSAVLSSVSIDHAKLFRDAVIAWAAKLSVIGTPAI
jgi:hypothetical protein